MKAKLIVASILLLVAMSASAEEPTTTQDELGMNQKLARVYDLYRKGDAVSLKPNEMMMGVGMAYTTANTNTFGIQQSARALNTQVFAIRGFGSGTEVSASLPYIAQSQRVEMAGTILESKNVSGFGDPTIRMMKMFQTKDVGTTGILSVTLPKEVVSFPARKLTPPSGQAGAKSCVQRSSQEVSHGSVIGIATQTASATTLGLASFLITRSLLVAK